MTAPTAPPPPGPPPAGPSPGTSSAELPPRPRNGSSPVPRAPGRGLLAGAFAGTPGRLRRFGGLAIGASLLFGGIGFVVTLGQHSDISDARSNAAQLVRVQTIRTNLVKADANATNAFLVGGLEPGEVRAAYNDGIATAARSLAEASSANADDEAALQGVNRVLARYAGLVESARANNRQGFPVGAAYLRQASSLIQDRALPALAALVTAEQARVDASVSATDSAVGQLMVVLFLVLLALVGLAVFLYAKTRRILNPSVVVATIIVLVAGLISVGVMAWARSATNDARSGVYARTAALATARINGFDAKSAEALTLINRGSGQPYEDRFQAVSGVATRALAPHLGSSNSGAAIVPTVAALEQYLQSHTAVRKLDDGGKWDEAVGLATGSGAANRHFGAFEQVSGRALRHEAGRLAADLDSARLPLAAMAWILLLAGIAAAIATWRGVNQRLREYR